MKTLKVAVLVALMSFVGHAQERSDADATYALKGPVRTMKVEVATKFISGSTEDIKNILSTSTG